MYHGLLLYRADRCTSHVQFVLIGRSNAVVTSVSVTVKLLRVQTPYTQATKTSLGAHASVLYIS
jgi:hypothetical protein